MSDTAGSDGALAVRQPEAVGAGFRGPAIVWAICTIARSGSTWLSQLVSSTHVLGYPEEYLLDWRLDSRRHLRLPPGISMEQYLAFLVESRSTPNGVFAIKGAVEELQPFFDHYPGTACIWLTRENKFQQAVSWHRAHDGGLWHRTAADPPARSFKVSMQRILWFHDEIIRRERLWAEFFAFHRMAPLCLTYESVCKDPLNTVRRIAEYLGVQSTIDSVSSPLTKVRDENSVRWAQLAEGVARSHQRTSTA